MCRCHDYFEYGSGLSVKEFKADIDKLIAEGHTKENAIFTVLKRYTVACKPIRFEGNGYSDEWKAEAARRGLDCETSVPLIFDRLLEQENIRMFGETGVLSEVELHARAEVKWETYTKKGTDRSPYIGRFGYESYLTGGFALPEYVAG